MGHSATISADLGGLSEYDLAQLALDGLTPGPFDGAAIEGFVLRNGQVLSYTLDTSLPAPHAPRVVPEQIAIMALFLASLATPLYHLLG